MNFCFIGICRCNVANTNDQRAAIQFNLAATYGDDALFLSLKLSLVMNIAQQKNGI